jgi:hypothetical protein
MMGGANPNPYAGQPLANNVQSAYTTALGQTGGLTDAGNTALGAAGGYGTQAGGLYGQMAGYTPSDVTPGQLATTDLSPYMNPYTQNVIDTTMAEMNHQQAIDQLGIQDQAIAQSGFGGSRQYVQQGILGGEYARARASELARLNQANYGNAQQMGQYDINNRFAGDQFNTDWRSRMFGGAASGLSGLAGQYGQLGSGLASGGISGLGNLANMGFGMGNQLQQNQLAAGALQQQQQQQLIDAIHAQYLGYTGSPQNSLSAYLGAILNPSGYGTQTSNPGLLSYIGAGANVAGQLGLGF